MKILIVEDQSGTLEVLESAVKKIVPKYFQDVNYDIARCYDEAEQMIHLGYEIVLLDHRMPRESAGNLEQRDFDAFRNTLQNIGYTIIDSIKKVNKETIIIGTSSLPEERHHFPDYVMRKGWQEAEEDLDMILTEVYNATSSP